jgi:hypothetical protein
MIVEIDIIGSDYFGTEEHLGTFKCEVSDDFFGPGWPFGQRRAFHGGGSESYIHQGKVYYRVSTRPKNKPVEEGDKS